MSQDRAPERRPVRFARVRTIIANAIAPQVEEVPAEDSSSAVLTNLTQSVTNLNEAATDIREVADQARSDLSRTTLRPTRRRLVSRLTDLVQPRRTEIVPSAVTISQLDAATTSISDAVGVISQSINALLEGEEQRANRRAREAEAADQRAIEIYNARAAAEGAITERWQYVTDRVVNNRRWILAGITVMTTGALLAAVGWFEQWSPEAREAAEKARIAQAEAAERARLDREAADLKKTQDFEARAPLRVDNEVKTPRGYVIRHPKLDPDAIYTQKGDPITVDASINKQPIHWTDVEVKQSSTWGGVFPSTTYELKTSEFPEISLENYKALDGTNNIMMKILVKGELQFPKDAVFDYRLPGIRPDLAAMGLDGEYVEIFNSKTGKSKYLKIDRPEGTIDPNIFRIRYFNKE